jgi:hypothetical protein
MFVYILPERPRNSQSQLKDSDYDKLQELGAAHGFKQRPNEGFAIDKLCICHIVPMSLVNMIHKRSGK